MNVNKVLLAGRLTRNPEMIKTPQGLPIAHFAIAVNRSWKDRNGEEKEEVCFVDVDAFGKQAEVIERYFGKGKPIFIEGRLRLDRWETDKGERKQRMHVVLEQFSFVPDGTKRQNGTATTVAIAAAAPSAPPEPEPALDESHDELDPVESRILEPTFAAATHGPPAPPPTVRDRLASAVVASGAGSYGAR